MGDVVSAPVEIELEPKRRSFLADLLIRLVKEKPLGSLGGVIIVVFFVTGIFAPIIAPYDENEMHPGAFLKPPSTQYLMGTDNLGRDVLSRIIFGARISMIVGLSASLLSTIIATIIGLVSGFYGGKLDIVVQRVVDAVMCFPWLFLVLGIMAIIGTGLLQLILILGVISGISSSRVVRSAAISVKENIYVEAARAVGCPTNRLLIRHILPNITAPIIIIFTISVGNMILSEATLSFLGYGIPPPAPSWGGMLTVAGRRYMLIAPWLVIWPGLALSLVVWGVNMLGDALRDLLDPRLRGRLGRYRAKAKKLDKNVGQPYTPS